MRVAHAGLQAPRARGILIAAVGGAEVHAARAVGERQRLVGQDERAADRIADHLRRCAAGVRAPAGPDSPSRIAVHGPPERPRDHA